MRKTPETQAEGILNSSLYRELYAFLERFPKSIEGIEDYKQFLDLYSQIPATIAELCKKTQNITELNNFHVGAIQLVGLQSATNLEILQAYNVPVRPNTYFNDYNIILQAAIYSTVNDSIQIFRGEARLSANEVKKINGALGEISNYGVFGDIQSGELTLLNNNLQATLEFHAAREMPASYVIELPITSNNDEKVWVLFETNFETGKLLFSLFFGSKEPSERKLDIIKMDGVKKNIEGPTFRDQVGVFSNISGSYIYHFGMLKLLLGDNYEKLRTLILLGIAPVTLRSEVTKDVYKNYGITINEAPLKHSNDGEYPIKTDSDAAPSGDGITSGGTTRNYPYNSALKIKILDLLEDDDSIERESNYRVIHKRLLPSLKRPDGTYASAKPSMKAINLAREKGFSLSIGIGFPEKGKCIYPEKIPELLLQLGATSIEEALTQLEILGETGTLRYETLVVPSQETPSDVQKIIKAKVKNITS